MTNKWAIRWRLQFRSKNNVGCLVNIYDDDETGTQNADTTKTGADVPFPVEEGVKELTGADNPFYFEERSSTDLFDMVKYHTGYINIKEIEEGTLDALRPTHTFSRFVTVYYGSMLVFSGYLQCQNYTYKLYDFPRDAKLAVVSPLGLLDGVKFEPTTEAGLVTVASVFDTVLNAVNPTGGQGVGTGYERIIFPMLSNTAGGTLSNTDANAPFSGMLNPHALCPLNTSAIYDTDTPEENIYEPLTMLDFVKGFCNAYGYMLHDTPSALVFTRFYYPTLAMGVHRYINVSSLSSSSLSGEQLNTSTTIGNSLNVKASPRLTFRDLTPSMTENAPVSETVTTVDGINTSDSAAVEFNLYEYQGESAYVHVYRNLDPSVESDIWLEDGEALEENYAAALCVPNGEPYGTEPKLILRIGYNAYQNFVIKKTFYGLSHIDLTELKLFVDYEYGDTLDPDSYFGLKDDDLSKDIEFSVFVYANGVQSGDIYYHITTKKTSFTINNIQDNILNSVGHLPTPLDNVTIALKLYNTSVTPEKHYGKYIRFKEISLKSDFLQGSPSQQRATQKYREQYRNLATKTKSRSLKFSAYRLSSKTSNIIFTFNRSGINFTVNNCMIAPKLPNQKYSTPYMGNVLKSVTMKMTRGTITTDEIKNKLYLFNWDLSALLGESLTAYVWRILSVRFYPWDDEYKLQFVQPDNTDPEV